MNVSQSSVIADWGGGGRGGVVGVGEEMEEEELDLGFGRQRQCRQQAPKNVGTRTRCTHK